MLFNHFAFSSKMNGEHGFVDSKTFRPTSIKKRFPKLYEDISAAVKHF